MDLRVGLWRRLSAEELMLLNCGVGEDSSLGLQGDQTSQSSWKSVLNIHGKDWCRSWSSNTLAIWCEELTHLKRPWCWERLKGMTEDEMAGWHHWLSGHEFEQALGDREGQGILAFWSPWGRKESDTTEQLNNNNPASYKTVSIKNIYFVKVKLSFPIDQCELFLCILLQTFKGIDKLVK